MPTITIEAFAIARERLGFSEMTMNVEAKNIAELLDELRSAHSDATEIINTCRIALNTEYAIGEDVLNDGDIVSIIPPVSGGSSARVTVAPGIIDFDAAMVKVKRDSAGAIVTFIGTVRNKSEGYAVRAIEYESKAEMAVRELERLITSAEKRFGITEGIIHHRTGRVNVGETSVLIAVTAEHRAEAFDACSWLLDELKKVAPIWKHEIRVVAGRDERVWLGEGGG